MYFIPYHVRRSGMLLAGIQKSLDFLDSGSRQLSPAWPEWRAVIQRPCLRACARGLNGTLFARAECQRAFRRYRPNFDRRAVVQAWKFLRDLCRLVQTPDLEQKESRNRFFRLGKRPVRD